jgi:hypothetical protein
MMAELRIVLMPEHGAPPIWKDRGPVQPDSLGLSPELSSAVLQWANEWEYGGGQESSDEEFASRGHELATRIQEELRSGVTVVYED